MTNFKKARLFLSPRTDPLSSSTSLTYLKNILKICRGMYYVSHFRCALQNINKIAISLPHPNEKNGKGWFFDLWIKQHSFLKFHFFSMLSQCALCNSNCPLKMTTVDRPKLLCNFEQTLPKENRLFIANIILAHFCNWCIVEFGLSKCFIYYSETRDIYQTREIKEPGN